jgi:thiamine biosynthesis protein ThiS
LPKTLSGLALWCAVLQTRRGMGDSIEIFVNGEAQSFKEALSVADLLALLGLPEKKIAVEHNLEIVPKSAYATHIVDAGDRIEIVHFIGGG